MTRVKTHWSIRQRSGSNPVPYGSKTLFLTTEVNYGPNAVTEAHLGRLSATGAVDQSITGYDRMAVQYTSEVTKAQIRLETTGEEFPIERGIRQGDAVSPKLFSATLEMVIRNLDWDKNGLNVNGETLNHLRFADDPILFSECPKRLVQMLQQLSDESAKSELSENTNKTKIMANGSQTYNIRVNMEEIDYV
ncbi:Retrovirus-related Pol polyprotein from type-1 retrotransposable element R2 [Eumeta japonica]|uniref:Retrovirus-related Pol polyprotein from type-1 retrotransposable element R2 n=1 Tax=Eumeta variegata TaxID=151549 RepID=A0A4C1W0B6_EUMVA|nr:Retrovirus-related Pol polyprotein from type-1 retrotransposable element R2 [Eumeta japonica]